MDGQFMGSDGLQFGGQLEPPSTDRGPSVLIDRTAGVNRGTMTANGGLAAAFDGVTNQTAPNVATGSSNGTGQFIGKTLAAPTAIDRVVIYGASDGGYVHGGNPSVEIQLRAKQGTYSANINDYAALGTTGVFTDTATTDQRTIDCTDKDTLWAHVILVYLQTSSNTSRCAEMQIYGWQ